MNKEVAEAVLERSHGLCEYKGCRSNYITQLHHIIHGKGKRTQCEKIESVICLCWNHHYGNNGVHSKDGKAIDLELKKDLQQKYYNMGMTEEEVRKWMGGRLYG